MIDVRRIDFYPADFFSGVAGMKADMIGVYWVVCTLLYLSDGAIWNTDHRLKSGAGVSYHRLPGILKELASMGKISMSKEGAITQQRVSNELARATQRISKARASGAQGGRPPNDNSDLGKPDGLFSENLSDIKHQPTVKEEREPKGSPKKPDRATRLDESWRPNDDGKQKARDKGLSPKEEFDKFQNHYLSCGGPNARKVSWDKAWLSWIAKARTPYVPPERRAAI